MQILNSKEERNDDDRLFYPKEESSAEDGDDPDVDQKDDDILTFNRCCWSKLKKLKSSKYSPQATASVNVDAYVHFSERKDYWYLS